MPWIDRKTRGMKSAESQELDNGRGRVLLAVLAGYLPAVWTALLLGKATELLLYGKPLRSRAYDAIEWQLTYLPIVYAPLFLPVAYWAARFALEQAGGKWWRLAISFAGLGALFAICARTSGTPTPERGELLSQGMSWAAGGVLYGLLVLLVCSTPSGNGNGSR